jgi:hypothetical protein
LYCVDIIDAHIYFQVISFKDMERLHPPWSSMLGVDPRTCFIKDMLVEMISHLGRSISLPIARLHPPACIDKSVLHYASTEAAPGQTA